MSKSYKLRNKDNSPNQYLLSIIGPNSFTSKAKFEEVKGRRKRRYMEGDMELNPPKAYRQNKNKSRRRVVKLQLKNIEKSYDIEETASSIAPDKKDAGYDYF